MKHSRIKELIVNPYIWWAVALFIVEVCIALFVRDQLIRPYGGDMIAVVLLYCLLRGVTSLNVASAAVCSFAIATLIEGIQFFGAIGQGHSLLHVALGTQFDWYDILAYVLGVALVLLVEYVVKEWRNRSI